MSHCKSCGAPILWAETVNGKNIPLDPTPSDTKGNVIVEDGVARVLKPQSLDWLDQVGKGTLLVPHFESCPDADWHRRRG